MSEGMAAKKTWAGKQRLDIEGGAVPAE